MAQQRPSARKFEQVNGVLLLDKPSGITSNLALQKARRYLNALKAGHTGTLDPLASGLLPLTFGEATKFSADLLDADKSYRATVQLGVRTSTADAEGEVLEQRPVAVTLAQLEAALQRLTGCIEQVPPMYSALKHAGQPLYKLARQGLSVERPARQVTVHRLQIVSFDTDVAVIDVDCSKGTYVRVLAEDLGALLGCGAHLKALRRTRVGSLDLAQAVALTALETLTLDQCRKHLLPVDALLANVPQVELDAVQTERFLKGMAQRITGDPGRKRVYGPQQRLLGVAELNEQGQLAPKRLVATQLTNEVM